MAEEPIEPVQPGFDADVPTPMGMLLQALSPGSIDKLKSADEYGRAVHRVPDPATQRKLKKEEG